MARRNGWEIPVNVKRLDGTLLNCWVAKSAGLKLLPAVPGPGDRHDQDSGYWHPQSFHPATDWTHGGPIVANEWYVLEDILCEWFGPTWTTVEAVVRDPLKWFMRAFVASMFGDEVEEVRVSDMVQPPAARVRAESADRFRPTA
jgi:hypothetical protein